MAVEELVSLDCHRQLGVVLARVSWLKRENRTATKKTCRRAGAIRGAAANRVDT